MSKTPNELYLLREARSESEKNGDCEVSEAIDTLGMREAMDVFSLERNFIKENDKK